MSAKLSQGGIVSLEPAVGSCLSTLVQGLRSTQGNIVDLVSWMEWFSFDITSAICFGESWGFMNQKADISGIGAGMKAGFHYAAIMGQFPALHPWLLGNPWLLKFLRRMTTQKDPCFEILKV
jgi:hypothetical protein